MQRNSGGKRVTKKDRVLTDRIFEVKISLFFDAALETRSWRNSQEERSGRIKTGNEEMGAEPKVWSWWNSAHRNL